jgi:hypothetical protein
MWIETIFYLAFISQIILISYFYPTRILARIDYILQHFPAEQYAKLYPKGVEKTLAGKKLYQRLNRANLIVGVIILAGIVAANQTGNLALRNLNSYPLVYGMLQAIPFLWLEISALKQFKMMRKLNTTSKRNAEFSPRSLFNFISPLRMLSTVFMLCACVFIMFSLNDFALSADITTLLVSMILCNGLFIGMGYMLINGKKLDPHQAPEDRRKMTIAVIHSYSSMSLLVSLFFIMNRCVEHYVLYDWEPLLNSLYWQGVVLLSTGTMLKFPKLEDTNFEVYKTEVVSGC